MVGLTVPNASHDTCGLNRSLVRIPLPTLDRGFPQVIAIRIIAVSLDLHFPNQDTVSLEFATHVELMAVSTLLLLIVSAVVGLIQQALKFVLFGDHALPLSISKAEACVLANKQGNEIARRIIVLKDDLVLIHKKPKLHFLSKEA